MKDLLNDIDRWRGEDKRVALARVVDIEGSGPREPGAASVRAVSVERMAADGQIRVRLGAAHHLQVASGQAGHQAANGSSSCRPSMTSKRFRMTLPVKPQMSRSRQR